MGTLQNFLATGPRAARHAVADAASLPGLLEPMYALGRGSFSCLLPGDVPADLAHVAPYLIALREDSPMTVWLESRLDRPWGYLVESDLPLPRLALHLRRFAETRGPHGEEWLFRFWDPRVLRAMAAILSAAQGQAFMEGIACLFLLDARGEPVSVRWDGSGGRLRFSDEVPQPEQGAVHAGI